MTVEDYIIETELNNAADTNRIIMLYPVVSTLLIILYYLGRSKTPAKYRFHTPANTTLLTNAGLMLGQRRRRWANINPALVQRLVFTGTRLWNLENT